MLRADSIAAAGTASGAARIWLPILGTEVALSAASTIHEVIFSDELIGREGQNAPSESADEGSAAPVFSWSENGELPEGSMWSNNKLVHCMCDESFAATGTA